VENTLNTSFIQKVQDTQAAQSEKALADKRLAIIVDAIGAKVSTHDVRVLGSSVETLNEALKRLESLDIKVGGDKELRDALGTLSDAVSAIEVNPVIKVPEPKVIVQDTPVDLKPLIDKMAAVEKAIKENKTQIEAADNSELEAAVRATTDAINSLQFPVANYVLPYANQDGAAVQVELDADGKVPVSGTFSTTPQTSTTATTSSVAGSASSTTLLSSNTSRIGATISNDSTAALYLKLGTTASTSSYTIKLLTDDYYEVPFAYTGRIDGIWASATGNARITELT
jgi:hypothetical protein